MFTSGKMRLMVQFMNQTGSEMAEVFGRAAESGEDLDAHRWSKSFSLGCNSIDTLNFGHETGPQTGPRSGPNSVLEH